MGLAANGNAGTLAPTQTAQALALDAGLVPAARRDGVLDALVELVYAFHPNGDGPHFSGGTIGMAAAVRALAAGNRDDVSWELLQEDDQPSYGYFMASTPANPRRHDRDGERWTRGDSKNHMILAQIEEWFHASLAGIRPADGTTAYRDLIIQPEPVGDLRHVRGSYETLRGTARSSWTRSDHRFELKVPVPPTRPPRSGYRQAGRRRCAITRGLNRTDGECAVLSVPAGLPADTSSEPSPAGTTT